jgi:hypothetical protein
MTLNFRIFGSAGFLFTCLLQPCRGSSDSDLKVIREIATSLLNRSPSATPDAYCELTTMRPTNSCTNSDRLEDRLVAHQNGTLARVTFRSWAEQPDPRPGEYKGKFNPAQWKVLLQSLSKMNWVEPKYDMPPPGPPGPSETYSNLTLSDGKRKASYSLAGMGPMDQALISDAFDQMSILGRNATDTVWTLSLHPQKGKLKNGAVNVEAKWVMTGKAPIEVSIPSSRGDSTCGTTTLAWYYDKPETPGVTPLPVEFEYVRANVRPIANPPWVKLDVNTSSPSQYLFQLPKKLQKEKKAGKLSQLGVLVKPPGATAPINVSLFSESFTF